VDLSARSSSNALQWDSLYGQEPGKTTPRGDFLFSQPTQPPPRTPKSNT
jgi:hypothetical protein